MNLTIRHAKVEDAPKIGEAEREIAKVPGFFCSQPSELSDENCAKTIAALNENKQGVYLVAESSGQIVGHAFLEPLGLESLRHTADLNIAVHLGWQKKGIGTKLLEHIIDWAKKSEKIEKIQLNVRASNLLALSLYRKMGFREEGRIKNKVKIKDYYIDDILMGLDIRDPHHVNLNQEAVIIREMHENDRESLINTFCFPWSSTKETTNKWTHYYNEQVKHIRSVYLIERKGQIIGYASLLRHSNYPDFKNKGIPEINDLWVLDKHRDQGFGRRLVQHLENRALEENYSAIGLGVGLYFDYGNAQKLYFHLGYVPDGKGMTYKGDPVVPGNSYPVDDDLLIWLIKDLP